VDFLRYYAGAAETFEADSHRPLGPVVCISPWNFPLAIFTGQIAAALAAGNPVLAKPAEETPLIAAAAVKILREAGVPPAALQLLPGDGSVGAALVADPRTCGVLFTGSTDVARLIRAQLAARLGPDGRPVPLVAETGGQNALVVDSSALPEQVVADALVSAFDSAGQRCSALRLLCLQEETAERVLAMLRGALAEWCVGDPALLSTDMGPLITTAARASIAAYVEAMRARGFKIAQAPLPEACRHGTFLPPTVIEIDQVGDLTHEVFGPVLHVLRYRRDERDTLIDAINATGYGLTFGLHTRIDETIAQVETQISAGNLYINRNLIGAVVGVQPFGGHGLSGTGPKAGGPLYLRRLLAQCPPLEPLAPAPVDAAARAWIAHLAAQGHRAHAARCTALADQGLAGAEREMAGPVGERNLYSWHPRGAVLLVPATPLGMSVQMATALAAGNRVLVDAPEALTASLENLPAEVKARVALVENRATAAFDAVLFEGESDRLLALEQEMAQREGPIVAVHGLSPGALAAGASYPVEWLLRERTISTNTAAAGGNATLLALG